MLVWGGAFVRAYKRAVKKRPEIEGQIKRALSLLQDDPFSLELETHKLRGRLAGSWACRVGYDLRIIFEFVENADREKKDILLLEIGTHDEVY